MALSQAAAARKDRRTVDASMTHQHFAFIANVIEEITDPKVHQDMIDLFAKRLRWTNPRFDEARFRAACKQLRP